MDPADTDVEQLASIAQRDAARPVDAVLADPVVTFGGDGGVVGLALVRGAKTCVGVRRPMAP